MNSFGKTDHAAMDAHPRNRLPKNHHVHQEMVDRFCDYITKRDPWMWREAAGHIRANIDYSQPVKTIVTRPLDPSDPERGCEQCTIWATLKSGQSITLMMRETGWSIEYGKPLAGRSS
jgi:hypothetical protein